MTHARSSDVQQGIVYGFENDCVERISPEFLGREDIHDLIVRAANHSRIPIPKIVFRGDSPMPCLANVNTWEITISDWGRNPTTVLHEIAHLVTFNEPRGRAEMMRGQAHGPCFLRNAIDLYSDFIGVTRTELEQRAREFGLEIAPSVLADAPSIARNTFDEDF